jgi:hypothetical protein
MRWSMRPLIRWQPLTSQVTVVMDLGFKSDPNMHRARSGPFRVRIEAGQLWVGAGQDF